MTTNVYLEIKAKDAIKAVERNDLIIAIDVLRCSSSILSAFANGAKEVIPAKTFKQARSLRNIHPDYLLAGERGGLKPRGFDFGNSPLEFTREKVYEKTLIMTTTSGTDTLTRLKAIKWVLIGAFVNVEFVAATALEIAEKEKRDVSLILSGRKGLFSLEDFICGGVIAEKLQERKANLTDASFSAFLAFRHAKGNLLLNIIKGEHAKHLIKLGFREDIEYACQLNIINIVPIYKDGIIRLPK